MPMTARDLLCFPDECVCRVCKAPRDAEDLYVWEVNVVDPREPDDVLMLSVLYCGDSEVCTAGAPAVAEADIKPMGVEKTTKSMTPITPPTALSALPPIRPATGDRGEFCH